MTDCHAPQLEVVASPEVELLDERPDGETAIHAERRANLARYKRIVQINLLAVVRSEIVHHTTTKQDILDLLDKRADALKAELHEIRV